MDTSACSQCGEKISPQWIVCPVCTHPTESSEALSPKIPCLECNGAISPEDLSCPHCHVPIIRRYCSSCERLIPDHVLFCPYCGATPAKKRTLRNVLKIGAIGAAAGFLVLVFLLYYRVHAVPAKNSTPIIANRPEPKQFEAFQQPVEIKPSPESISLIVSEPVVVLRSSNPFDTVDLAPPKVTNTVVESFKESPPVTDLVERGTRLKQGRKLSQIGAQYIRTGRYQQAIIVLRKAIEAFPPQTRDVTYGESLYHLGFSLRMAGKPEEAIPVLKLALQFPLYTSKVSKELKTASAQIKKFR